MAGYLLENAMKKNIFWLLSSNSLILFPALFAIQEAKIRPVAHMFKAVQKSFSDLYHFFGSTLINEKNKTNILKSLHSRQNGTNPSQNETAHHLVVWKAAIFLALYTCPPKAAVGLFYYLTGAATAPTGTTGG